VPEPFEAPGPPLRSQAMEEQTRNEQEGDCDTFHIGPHRVLSVLDDWIRTFEIEISRRGLGADRFAWHG